MVVVDGAICERFFADRILLSHVYHNFPWPEVRDLQKDVIEKLAQSVLDARSQFPKSSLVDFPPTCPKRARSQHSRDIPLSMYVRFIHSNDFERAEVPMKSSFFCMVQTRKWLVGIDGIGISCHSLQRQRRVESQSCWKFPQ